MSTTVEVVDGPEPVVVNVVERGAQGLSAFAVWKIQQNRPDAVEQDFWSYLAGLAGGAGGGGGVAQQRFAVNGVASYRAVHTLSGRPSVTLMKLDGTLVYTDVSYAEGVVTLTFPQPFTGVLYLG